MVSMCELVTVSVSATRSDAREMDPSIVSVANRWPTPRAMEPAVPVKLTVEPVAVSVDAEEVSQEPAMDIVEDPRARTAGPVEVRFPLNTDVVLVRLSVPDQVMFDANVVLVPGLTTRLNRICVTLMEPPDALTMTVEVPVANAPADVLIDRTVMTLALAARAPPTPTVTEPAVSGKLPPEVESVVAPAPAPP